MAGRHTTTITGHQHIVTTLTIIIITTITITIIGETGTSKRKPSPATASRAYHDNHHIHAQTLLCHHLAGSLSLCRPP